MRNTVTLAAARPRYEEGNIAKCPNTRLGDVVPPRGVDTRAAGVGGGMSPSCPTRGRIEHVEQRDTPSWPRTKLLQRVDRATDTAHVTVRRALRLVLRPRPPRKLVARPTERLVPKDAVRSAAGEQVPVGGDGQHGVAGLRVLGADHVFGHNAAVAVRAPLSTPRATPSRQHTHSDVLSFYPTCQQIQSRYGPALAAPRPRADGVLSAGQNCPRQGTSTAATPHTHCARFGLAGEAM